MNLIEQDSAHVIHPYAKPIGHPPPLLVERTQGCKLYLESGQALVDGMSSWWAAIHGYNHPALLAAASEQLAQMPHVMFGGLTHRPAVSLAQQLVAVTGLDRVFLCDSGSVAVEVAIKMALQYWQAQHQPKQKLLTIRGGYHGDTFATMSICDPVNGMHQHFQGFLYEHIFVDRPYGLGQEPNDDDFLAVEQAVRANKDQLAAIIVEPIVQGAGGMRVYRAEYLANLRRICDENDILLIADEIATGFGRTGKYFACEHADIRPDIMCVGKALTGGVMSLAATLCTDHIALKISQGAPGLLMHGPTFMGNPLACRIALASLELLKNQVWMSQVQAIEQHFNSQLLPLMQCEQVIDVRVIGAIGVIELKKPLDPEHVTRVLLKNGVWLRPFGRLLYAMPPYIISESELEQLTATMIELAQS